MFYSIITITYNDLDGLKQTTESLLAQSCDDYEWIVIDGGSDDGTVDYLNTLKAKFISEPDRGIYDAMNKGLLKAQGEYILFLNAGDCLASRDVLKKVHSFIKEAGKAIDFVYGDAYERDENNCRYLKPARPAHAYKWGMITHHQAMFYRRESVSDLFYDLKYEIAADYKFTCEFIRKAHHLLYMEIPICSFEGGGISQRKTKSARKEQFLIRKELKLASSCENYFISFIQRLTLILKLCSPPFYWYVRSRWMADKKL